jgi:alpha,alpha-trehalose phosphorylase
MRRNFDYYDPLTTGDSSLSACVQSIVAAEVGLSTEAVQYFYQSLYLDLLDSHGNTADGFHIANAGGVWAALVHGFAGMHDSGESLRFAPRLPADWSAIRLRFMRHGTRAMVHVEHDGYLIQVLDGDPLPVKTPDGAVMLAAGQELRVPAS